MSESHPTDPLRPDEHPAGRRTAPGTIRPGLLRRVLVSGGIGIAIGAALGAVAGLLLALALGQELALTIGLALLGAAIFGLAFGMFVAAREDGRVDDAVHD